MAEDETKKVEGAEEFVAPETGSETQFSSEENRIKKIGKEFGSEYFDGIDHWAPETYIDKGRPILGMVSTTIKNNLLRCGIEDTDPDFKKLRDSLYQACNDLSDVYERRVRENYNNEVRRTNEKND